jgi:hypothetical protein
MSKHPLRFKGETRDLKLPKHSFNKHLGNWYRVKFEEVIFIGNQGETFCLTPGKKYKIIDLVDGKNCFDKDLKARLKKEKKRVHVSQYDQGENRLLVLINDKGHKRKYNHQMFKLSEEK